MVKQTSIALLSPLCIRFHLCSSAASGPAYSAAAYVTFMHLLLPLLLCCRCCFAVVAAAHSAAATAAVPAAPVQALLLLQELQQPLRPFNPQPLQQCQVRPCLSRIEHQSIMWRACRLRCEPGRQEQCLCQLDGKCSVNAWAKHWSAPSSQRSQMCHMLSAAFALRLHAHWAERSIRLNAAGPSRQMLWTQ